MPLNLPIFLTWLRIVLIPLIVSVFYLPDGVLAPADKNLLAALIFILAALTDWFDGFLARRLNQTSSFGAFLDPVADKLIVAAALLMLVQLARLNAAVALVIIGREIAISALREWMAQRGASKNVAVNSLGKVKTVCQMGAIPLLLFSRILKFDGSVLHSASSIIIDTQLWGKRLIYLAAALTIWSMLYYMKLAWPQIQKRAGIT